MRTNHTPQPCSRKTKDGKRIPFRERAQASAKHLATTTWKSNSEAAAQMRTDKIILEAQHYKTTNIDLNELISAINELKRRRAPGPDEIPIECYKEMDQEALLEILAILNTWWSD